VVAAGPQQPNRREEAEIRKLEAETTAIRVRTVLLAVVVIAGILATLFGGHLIAHWLPAPL
jgi:hypothetical protein